MKYTPILFSGQMVRSLLLGTKTKTRRIINPQPPDGYTPKLLKDHFDNLFLENRKSSIEMDFKPAKLRWQKGDVLWVRETIYQNGELGLQYVADGEDIDEDIIPMDFNVRLDKNGNYKFCKIPNIYMEKWACRIFLKVKSVRIEKLQNISESDAIAEGVERIKPDGMLSFRSYVVKDGGSGVFPYVSFETLWKSINGWNSWNSNPYVWVIEFERIEKPTDFN